MPVIEIPYFVYTSGEEGLSNLDWGVKFASPSLDKDNLQKEYSKIEQNYGLSLKDERPSELGILVLNNFLSYGLIGFVYPSNDSESQGKRPNITLIACLISDEIKSKSKLDNLINLIFHQNNLEEIACLDKEKIDSLIKRPDFISLDFERTNDVDIKSKSNLLPENCKNFDWKSNITGYWIKDKNTKELSLTANIENITRTDNHEQKGKEGKKSMKGTFIPIVLIIVITAASIIASIFIGEINKYFPDDKEIETKTEIVKEINPIDEIKDKIVSNINDYANKYAKNNNVFFAGIGQLKNKKGGRYEIESFSTSISDLKKISSFECKSEIEYDIVCEEKELEEAINSIIKEKRNKIYKLDKDNFFRADFANEPYKEINNGLKKKFNNDSSTVKEEFNSFNKEKIKNYVDNFFDSIPDEKKNVLVDKYKDSKNIYMPADFKGFIFVFNKNKYICKTVESDGLSFFRPIGEFFLNKEKYYKLPIIPNNENSNFYIKKDGNYYKFGKIDASLTENNKDKIIREFANKYFNYIREKNK